MFGFPRALAPVLCPRFNASEASIAYPSLGWG